MIYYRAGKKPVCFIPGPVYTGSVLIEVKPGHIPTSTHYCLQAQTGSWSWKRREKGKETEKEKEMLIERTTMLMSEREMKLAIPKTWMDSGASSTQHQT